ncbi:MAG: hypothetical protein VR64_22285 [Desulfatitalea sp. BRH_c12]|nr:MAG: hypothetical protein VR64_22285 [Desulfatitalea sp. BRH_c12]
MNLVSISASPAWNFINSHAPNAVAELTAAIKEGLCVQSLVKTFHDMPDTPPEIREAFVEMVIAIDGQVHPPFKQIKDETFRDCLELARDFSNVPYTILDRAADEQKSANEDIAGVRIGIENDNHRARVLYGLLKAGFRRIGLAPGFIYTDLAGGTDDRPNDFAWVYCHGKAGSCKQRFALLKAMVIDAGVLHFEVGRDYVFAKTYAGAKDAVSIDF